MLAFVHVCVASSRVIIGLEACRQDGFSLEVIGLFSLVVAIIYAANIQIRAWHLTDLRALAPIAGMLTVTGFCLFVLVPNFEIETATRFGSMNIVIDLYGWFVVVQALMFIGLLLNVRESLDQERPNESAPTQH